MRFLAFCAVILCAGANAQEALEQRFVDCAVKEGMAPAAFFSLSSRGVEHASVAIETDVDATMAVGSISKTIAGQCLMELVDAGFVSLDDTVAEHFGWAGPQGTVTLADLVTHTSGYGPDATQGDMLGRLPRNKERMAALVDGVAVRDMEERGSHSYNNENFLILESVLTEALGEPALDWCMRRVGLETVRVFEDLSAFGLAGALSMSARELAEFFGELTPSDAWPQVALGGANAYGPGIIVQTVEPGVNLFHTGGYCAIRGPNIGALGVKLFNGASVGMVWSGCADVEDLRLLNAIVLEHLEK